MKINVAGWKIATYGAWGAGAVVAFIGVLLPWVYKYIALAREPYATSVTTDVAGATTLILAVVAFGAMLILLIAKPPEALPCLVAFGSTVAIVIIGIVNLQDIDALEPFSKPGDVSSADSEGFYRTGNGVRLVLVGGIVSCVGSFAFPLTGTLASLPETLTDKGASGEARCGHRPRRASFGTGAGRRCGRSRPRRRTRGRRGSRSCRRSPAAPSAEPRPRGRHPGGHWRGGRFGAPASFHCLRVEHL